MSHQIFQTAKDSYINNLPDKQLQKLLILNAILGKDSFMEIAKRFDVSLKRVESIEKEYETGIAININRGVW
jgi:DNA-directed RNA polymerase specialized sigma24 family protein